jgi:GT2 family glycosyltransferase
MSAPLLSILIVNWRVPEMLVEAVRSARDLGGIPADRLEFLVADNASGDDSEARFREAFPDLDLTVFSENLGFGRANNRLFARARGRYVLLLNPDTVVTSGALATLVAVLESDSRIGILGCRLVNADGSFQRAGGGAFPTLRNLAWNYFFLNKLLPGAWAPPPFFLEDDPSGTFDIEWVSGAVLLLRPEALDGRLFDEAFFMYGEDLELCHRVRASGWRVAYTAEATVMHLNGGSMRRQNDAAVLAAPLKGPRAFYEKLHGPRWGWLFACILFAGYALRWPLYGTLATLRRRADYRVLATSARRHAITAARLVAAGRGA